MPFYLTCTGTIRWSCGDAVRLAIDATALLMHLIAFIERRGRDGSDVGEISY